MSMRGRNYYERLKSLTPEQPKCTIYQVHKHLRSINEKAYDPQVIAIGPYHRAKKNLEMMENHKLRYMNSLLETTGKSFETYCRTINLLESKARECYAEDTSHISQTDFIEMLVLDGCFIIQLARKFSRKSLENLENDSTIIAENDPIFQMDWIVKSLQHDLMLFENQIPFFILLELFKLIENEDSDQRKLMELLFHFSENLYPGKGYRNNNNRNLDEIKHLLDLVYNNWLPLSSSIVCEKSQSKMRYIDTAKELKDSNVQFLKSDECDLFEVRFQNGIMKMATLSVGDYTESFLRNLIVYEQYFQDHKTSFVTDYVLFLDFLIDTAKDVKILSGANILDNWLGDDEVTANMFNKLADWIDRPDDTFAYGKILCDVNAHCNQPKNRYWAVLRHNYVNTPWAIISIIVGLIILILTTTQAVCSIVEC